MSKSSDTRPPKIGQFTHFFPLFIENIYYIVRKIFLLNRKLVFSNKCNKEKMMHSEYFFSIDFWYFPFGKRGFKNYIPIANDIILTLCKNFIKFEIFLNQHMLFHFHSIFWVFHISITFHSKSNDIQKTIQLFRRTNIMFPYLSLI